MFKDFAQAVWSYKKNTVCTKDKQTCVWLLSQTPTGLSTCAVVKNLPVSAGAAKDTSLNTGLGRSLEKGMAPSTAFLPGELHGQRSLAGYSPWGHQELDTTEHAHAYAHTHTHTHTHIHTLTPTKNDVIVSLKGLKTTLSNFHISSKTLWQSHLPS